MSESLMNQELKTKWVNALRSGEYKQTTGCLERKRGGKPIGNCCLGVLCHIAGIDYIKDEYDRTFFACGIVTIQEPYLNKLGLSKVERDCLINMNDGEEELKIPRHTFSEIADYIEEHIEAA